MTIIIEFTLAPTKMDALTDTLLDQIRVAKFDPWHPRARSLLPEGMVEKRRLHYHLWQ
ncbi:MAG: hypothetical protein OES09_12795 [Gammaproteobacteria bacterium]|nr:hypothetical protein [Gammaproteobacteria bacterium]